MLRIVIFFHLSLYRFKVHRSGLPLFMGRYKSRRHCFKPPRLIILIQFYSYSVLPSAYESVAQIGAEPEPFNREP